MRFHVVNDYALIDAGSALAMGPLLIKKPETILNPESLIAFEQIYNCEYVTLSCIPQVEK